LCHDIGNFIERRKYILVPQINLSVGKFTEQDTNVSLSPYIHSAVW